jgi:hypothetical protein
MRASGFRASLIRASSIRDRKVDINRPKPISMLVDVRIGRGRDDTRFHLSFVRFFLPARLPEANVDEGVHRCLPVPRKCLRCPPTLCRIAMRGHGCPPGAVAAKRAAIGRLSGVFRNSQPTTRPRGLVSGNAVLLPQCICHALALVRHGVKLDLQKFQPFEVIVNEGWHRKTLLRAERLNGIHRGRSSRRQITRQ